MPYPYRQHSPWARIKLSIKNLNFVQYYFSRMSCSTRNFRQSRAARCRGNPRLCRTIDTFVSIGRNKRMCHLFTDDSFFPFIFCLFTLITRCNECRRAFYPEHSLTRMSKGVCEFFRIQFLFYPVATFVALRDLPNHLIGFCMRPPGWMRFIHSDGYNLLIFLCQCSFRSHS